MAALSMHTTVGRRMLGQDLASVRKSGRVHVIKKYDARYLFAIVNNGKRVMLNSRAARRKNAQWTPSFCY